MIKRGFSYDDQLSFAKLAGDYNPVHLDKVYARRLLFGQIVVHGIHLLLWSIDVWLEKQLQPLRITALEARFLRSVGMDEECDCAWKADKHQIEITVMCRDAIVMRAILKTKPVFKTKSIPVPDSLPKREECANLSIEDASTSVGKVKLLLCCNLINKHFPNATRILPSVQIAEMLATTRVAGMKCPGLHSLYSALDITFEDKMRKLSYLEYEVSKFDNRFSLFSIKVKGPDMSGMVKAFSLPAPKIQDSFAVISEKVLPQEFKNIVAIVIGGSRGLGEVTAKILAAGGARVCITFYHGIDDAKKIAEEINSAGGYVDYMHFNVLGNQADMESELKLKIEPNQLYYFATPFLEKLAKRIFSDKLFRIFCRYYVTGFNNTVNAILKSEVACRKIFYPSSIAVDSFPMSMGEYAAAKAAGETLCTFLERANSELVVYKPRLPMVSTDLTASIGSKSGEDPVPIMLDYIRRLRDGK